MVLSVSLSVNLEYDICDDRDLEDFDDFDDFDLDDLFVIVDADERADSPPTERTLRGSSVGRLSRRFRFFFFLADLGFDVGV